MDWIEKFGHEVVRINENCQIINITSSFYESENNFTFVLNDGRRISSQNVSSFWFRRGGLRFSQSHFPTMNQSIGINVTNHLKDEVKTLISYILFYLQNKTKIGDYSQRNANKLISLQIAQECGLRIPKTCISSQKTDLMDFSSECTSSITKSIQDILFFHVNDERFSTKTSKVTMADINTMDDIFFPSLLQEEIKKKYELRIFYLKGEFFPMAIFSQEDEQTKVDFRNYNKSKPNRCVPYKLPDYIMKKLDLFMQRMNLDTGSIDMIYTTNKEYVFLEVNPVGQYDMVSVPCNYNLHQKIAKYLCQ